LFSAGGFNLALWFGVGLMTFCLICVIGMVAIDVYAEKKYPSKAKDADADDGKFNLRALLQFSSAFWLITVSCLVVYACVLPFNNISNQFLQQKYGYDKATAGAIMGIPFIISAVSSPFLGGVVDYFGQRAILLTASAVFLCLTHSLMAFTRITPYLTLSILGASYAIYSSAMWPAVAFVVEKENLGLAYGIATSVQNTGLFSFPLIVGDIRDRFGNYNVVEIFFASIALAGIVVGLVLNYVDHTKSNDVLNKSCMRNLKEKKIVEAAKLLDEEDDNVSESSILTA
jgi:nitrate/nitrite transporter NarK